MVNDRSSRSAAPNGAPIDFPNLFARSHGWGGRGALFTGNCTDAVAEQSPDVSSPVFVSSGKALAVAAEDRRRSAPVDHDGAVPQPICTSPRSTAAIGEIDFVIFGCGDFGAQIAVELAAHGARHFLLTDAGRIDENDIRHLPWVNRTDLGSLKTDKLASYLASRFSAHVFALPVLADNGTTLQLIAEYANNPFVVLAGDVRLAHAFLDACRASAAGIPPHFHVSRRRGPGSSLSLPAASDCAFIAGLDVPQIAQACLAKHSTQRARQWTSDVKNAHTGRRSPRTDLYCLDISGRSRRG